MTDPIGLHRTNLAAMHRVRKTPRPLDELRHGLTCAEHSAFIVGVCLACMAAARALQGRSTRHDRSVQAQAIAEGAVLLRRDDMPPHVRARRAVHKLRLAHLWVTRTDPMPDDVAKRIQAAIADEVEASNQRTSDHFRDNERETATS